MRRAKRWYYTRGVTPYKQGRTSSRQASAQRAQEHAITAPLIIPRAEHTLSRADISKGALKVLYGLSKAGYEAYLVGGGVRDVLVGMHPKDFDVVTDAQPEEIRAVFRSSRLIGRRFRLAHVRVGREIIEVATFRASPEEEDEHPDRESVDGRIVRDNVYGTLEEDAWRRDFTVNALYYDIRDFTLVDYTGGMSDLAARRISLIGDPRKRYREDPVRTLRAVRFAAKLDFEIAPETARLIPEFATELEAIPPARLFEEVLKLYLSGHAVRVHALLREHAVFEHLFPATARLLDEAPDGPAARLLERALANTDARIAEGKPVTPAFAFAALLWPPALERFEALRAGERSDLQAMEAAGADAFAEQAERVAVPKRFAFAAREIWEMQPRLARYRGKRGRQLLGWPRFRAAYDFLLLRAEAGEDVAQIAEYWTRAQSDDASGESAEPAEGGDGARPGAGRRRRRRRRRGPRESGTTATS